MGKTAGYNMLRQPVCKASPKPFCPTVLIGIVPPKTFAEPSGLPSLVAPTVTAPYMPCSQARVLVPPRSQFQLGSLSTSIYMFDGRTFTNRIGSRKPR